MKFVCSVVVDTKYCSHTEEAVLGIEGRMIHNNIMKQTSPLLANNYSYIHEVILCVVVCVRVPETPTAHPA